MESSSRFNLKIENEKKFINFRLLVVSTNVLSKFFWILIVLFLLAGNDEVRTFLFYTNTHWLVDRQKENSAEQRNQIKIIRNKKE